MEDKKGVKKYLKKWFPQNPLSYFGWLGFLGVFGLLFFVPNMVPFLLCFSFFSYRNKIADELFWNNVRKAGTRAFCCSFVFDVLGLLFLIYRGFTCGFERAVFEAGYVTIEEGLYWQYEFVMLFFIIGLELLLCVFSISMMRFKKREKKLLRGQE